MRRITSLSSVGRAPDCSCISTKRLSRHQGVPSSSLGAGTIFDHPLGRADSVQQDHCLRS